MNNENLNCPACGAALKDWREFIRLNPNYAYEGERETPFECVGFRCGKRFKTEEILQNE